MMEGALIVIGRAWYGMEWTERWNGMERKFRYGIWKMPEWNGMFSRMQWKTILDFAHGIYRKLCTGSDN